MNFTFVIGTPPYEDKSRQGDNMFAPPVYHLFMNLAFNIASKVLLVTPAHFLHNRGATPKEWNEKMTNDPHFKVLRHVQKSTLFFPETDIKGGCNLLSWR